MRSFKLIKKVTAFWHQQSFVKQIAALFLLLWVIPMLGLIVFNHDFTLRQFNKKIVSFSSVSMQQTAQNINNRLLSYEQALAQLIYGDTFLSEISRFNEAVSDQSIATARNTMVSAMRTFVFSHDFVRNVVFVAPSGICAYDISMESITDAYLDNFPASITGLDNAGFDIPLWLPTRYLYTPAKEPYYVFTLRSKIYNVFNLNSNGSMIMSVDSSMLAEICGFSLLSDNLDEHFIMIIDEDGRMIYHYDPSYYEQETNNFLDAKTLESVLAAESSDESISTQINSQNFILNVATVPRTNWRVISALSQKYISHEVVVFQQVLTSMIIIQLVLLFSALLLIMHTLSRFMRKLVGVMDTAPDHNFSVQIEGAGQHEIGIVTEHFNQMMATIKQLMTDLENQTEKVRLATQQGKEAEIRALEAQINPHFLYNTLDYINWLAIESNQFEISDMLGMLASLFRYSIQDSNKKVTIREECDYLINYLRIQKCRNAVNFDYLLDIESGVREFYIYKLIFQPLIENVVLHAFSNLNRPGLVTLSFRQVSEDRICFSLNDNGRGMTQEDAEALFSDGAQAGIGISNVISRLRLYYDSNSEIQVFSSPDKGLTIKVYFPVIRHADEENQDA